jgi:hypothetical protein
MVKRSRKISRRYTKGHQTKKRERRNTRGRQTKNRVRRRRRSRKKVGGILSFKRNKFQVGDQIRANHRSSVKNLDLSDPSPPINSDNSTYDVIGKKRKGLKLKKYLIINCMMRPGEEFLISPENVTRVNATSRPTIPPGVSGHSASKLDASS